MVFFHSHTCALFLQTPAGISGLLPGRKRCWRILFTQGVGFLLVSFSAMSTLHLKRYHPASFKIQKLIMLLFSCLVSLFITPMYLLLHSSHSLLHLLCFLEVPYLPLTNMNTKMFPLHVHLSSQSNCFMQKLSIFNKSDF